MCSLTHRLHPAALLEPVSEPDLFGQAWDAHLAAQPLTSPLDHKARAFARFYFTQDVRSMVGAAALYGIDRQTATRRMARSVTLGWVLAGESPRQAGPKTPHRVYLRRCFWSPTPWESAHALSDHVEKVPHLYKGVVHPPRSSARLDLPCIEELWSSIHRGVESRSHTYRPLRVGTESQRIRVESEKLPTVTEWLALRASA